MGKGFDCRGKMWPSSPIGRAGSSQPIQHQTTLFLILIGQMIVLGSTYWDFGYGLDPGEVEKDEEGVKTMKDLGVNMAWLLKKLQD
jgi:multimeric flavodoxin WrbA